MATESSESGNTEFVGKGSASEQSDPLASKYDDGEEDEEDMCRICRTAGENLFYPCSCSGSIKYVHQECLLQWLSHSHARQCEVCKHPFTFSPVYAENAPTRLSYREFVLGLTVKVGRGLHFFWRLGFVISIWLIFVPLVAFWIWRLIFARSLYEAQTLIFSRFTLSLLLTDCLCGFLLSAGILFVFVGATCIRDYFRQLRELGPNADQDDDNLVDRQQAGRRQLHGPAGDRLEGGARAEHRGGANREGQGFAAGAGQLLLRNAENVAARIELQAARHVEQIWDAIDAGDGAEDVPFDELFGMHGPVFEVVEHAFTLLASNAIFLALVVFVPFTIGRAVLQLACRLNFIGYFGIHVGSSFVPVGILNTTSGKLAVDLSQTAILENGTLVGSLVGKHADNLSNMIESTIGSNSWSFSDAATVAAGYGVILLAVCLHLCLRALINYSKGDPVVAGWLQAVAFVARAASAATRRVIAGIQYIMTLLKVSIVLFVELGVFPLLCGFWLDVCLLSILGGTIANHISFFWTAPLTSCLLHWLAGIIYMLHISIFVSLLREVLRPGVLYFLRDPADPNYNPFHDLVEDPIQKHARRVLLSVVVYGTLVVLLIFLPVKLAASTVPSVFPLNIRISDPFTEIPADMLLFHICIPFAIEHFRPKATVKALLFHWFSTMGWVLGLSEFLLPRAEEGNNQARRAVAGEVYQGHAQEVYQEQSPDVLDVNGLPDHSNEHMFAVRVLLLLLGAWLTLLVINSVTMLLPVSLGRAFFYAISRLPIAYVIKCNDLYAFNVGCYMIWVTVVGIKSGLDYCKKHGFRILAMQVLKWTAIVTKSSVLLSLWVVVIPVLIGLLFELLVVIPLRVPVDESPVFLLYQDWALGLVFLKIWTRLAMLGQVVPLVDESWRSKFEQVKADGFTRLRGFWVMREIVGPILMQLLTVLCVPYVFARGLFPVLGYSLITNSAVYRFAWSGCLMLGVLWYMGKCLHQWLLKLHNIIRDDRYLIGKRLHNFEERSNEKANLPCPGVEADEKSPANSYESTREASSKWQTSEQLAIIEELSTSVELRKMHGDVRAASS